MPTTAFSNLRSFHAFSGLGETYISYASMSLQEDFHGRAVSYIQNAIIVLARYLSFFVFSFIYLFAFVSLIVFICLCIYLCMIFFCSHERNKNLLGFAGNRLFLNYLSLGQTRLS